MANYETPITLRASDPRTHIYNVCNERTDSSHIYMDVNETFTDSDRHYPFPTRNTTRQSTELDIKRLNSRAKNDRKLERKNLKASLLMAIVVFFFGVMIGASVTACLFLIAPKDLPPNDDTFESPPGNKTFNTTEYYSLRMIRCDIGDIPYKEHRISFSVKACSNAYLVLTSEYDDSGPLLAILLGINGNSLSIIRAEIGGGNHVEYVSSELDCLSFKTFWITWTPNDTIKVGRGGESKFFMSKLDNRNLKFVNIGISTGGGSTGEWLFTKV